MLAGPGGAGTAASALRPLEGAAFSLKPEMAREPPGALVGRAGSWGKPELVLEVWAVQDPV